MSLNTCSYWDAVDSYCKFYIYC